MKRSLAIGLLLVCACVVEGRPLPPPVLPAREAVAIATQYARSRGLVIDYTKNVWLGPQARWHVLLGGAGGRDNAAIVLDGFSGRVLSAQLRSARGEHQPPSPAPSTEGPAAPPSGPPQEAPPPPPSTLPPPPPAS